MTFDLTDISFSREALLQGLPLHRAAFILYAIETQTAQLAARMRISALPKSVTYRSDQQEHQFMNTLAHGRTLEVDVSIQELERYAPEWAALVPESAKMRAALAHLIGQKYRLVYRYVPQIRAVLRLDDTEVQSAYSEGQHKPLETLFVAASPRERMRWIGARFAWWFEDLPPFWTAFALTFTETLDGSILALPIALAGVGTIPGVIILVVLGIVNILTLTGLSEAMIRSGKVRYGDSYFGRLVQDYLGQTGTLIFSATLFILFALFLLAYIIGLAETLEQSLRVPGPIWVLVIFAACVFIVTRKKFDIAAATAMIIGIAVLLIIIVLMALGLPHINLNSLTYVNLPFLNGLPFDAAIIELIFGVVLWVYFGHTAAANAAGPVLARDPSGRALIWGNIAGLAVSVVLYALFVIILNGAIPAAVLRETSDTALTPLADIAGPAVLALGSVFVVLGMGIGGLFACVGIVNQIREWLPHSPSEVSSSPMQRSLVSWASSRRGKFILSIGTLVLIFLVALGIVITRAESFSEVLAYSGALAMPLLAGIFPLLVLVASRRKGDYLPGVFFRWLSHPLLLIAIYAIFWVSMIVHGLVIWDALLPRVLSLVMGIVIVLITIQAVRRGAFKPRIVIEIRQNQNADGRTFYNVVAIGRPLSVTTTFDYANGESQQIETASAEIERLERLRSVTVELPQTSARELKVWIHQISNALDSLPVPAAVTLEGVEFSNAAAPAKSDILLPLPPTTRRVKITFGTIESSPFEKFVNLT